MHEICNIMGVTKTRTTAYHPCCNGQVEPQNRTLQVMLANYVSSQADYWDLLLDPPCSHTITANTSLLGLPHHELVFGKIPRMPLALEFGVTVANPSTSTEYAQCVEELFRM